MGSRRNLGDKKKEKEPEAFREGGSKGQEENQALVQGSLRRERAVKVGLGW